MGYKILDRGVYLATDKNAVSELVLKHHKDIAGHTKVQFMKTVPKTTPCVVVAEIGDGDSPASLKHYAIPEYRQKLANDLESFNFETGKSEYQTAELVGDDK